MAKLTRAPIRRRLARVDYVCDLHRGAEPADVHGTLTTLGGKWAYCRSPLFVGHHWVATGGVPVTQLLAELRIA